MQLAAQRVLLRLVGRRAFFDLQREVVVVVVEERKIYLMSWVVQEVVGARSEGLQIPLEV